MRRLRRRKDEEIIEGEIIEEAPTETAAPPRRGFFRRQKPIPSEEPYRERVAPDVPTPDEVEITEFTRRAPGRGTASRRAFGLPNVSRLLVWREIRPGLLLLALGMVLGGVFWTLHNLGRVPASYEEWWAVVLLGFALLWSATALIARQAAAFLAGTALAGVSISLLLDAQEIATWHETMVGIMLITIGLGIIARGLLLRQGSIAQ